MDEEDVIIPNETLLQARAELMNPALTDQPAVYACLRVMLRALLDKLIEEQGG